MVIDPYDPKMTGYKLPKLAADVVLLSHEHGDHGFVEGVSDYKLVINTPGEYEISNTFILGIPTFHDKKSGAERGKNTIYQVEIDGFNILHLGDLGHELSQETIEKLSSVDILMIPVGGVFTIDAEIAVKVISSLEPGIVIPMHYQTGDLTGLGKELADIKEFLEEVGVEDNGVKKVEKLKVSSKSDIPDESEVYVLSPQH